MRYKLPKEYQAKDYISEREKIRERKRELIKFSQLITNKYWWKSLSEDDKWHIFDERYKLMENSYYSKYLTGEKMTQAQNTWFPYWEEKYPGSLEIVRDLKIEKLLSA